MSLLRLEKSARARDLDSATPPPPERKALAMPAVPSVAGGAAETLLRGVAGISRAAAMSTPIAPPTNMSDAEAIPPAQAPAASRFPAAQLEEWPRRCVLTPECKANLAWCSC